VVSPPALASVVPSGLNATDSTNWWWPLSTAVWVRVAVFHSLIVLSRPPLARIVPSGLKASESTTSVCQASAAMLVWVAGFHSWIVLSKRAAADCAGAPWHGKRALMVSDRFAGSRFERGVPLERSEMIAS